MKFNYIEEEVGGMTVVTIPETGGVFYGYSTEQVSKIAETLHPNYQSHNMSSTFYDIYFNYCLRKTLEGQPIPKEYKNLIDNTKENKTEQELLEDFN